MDTVEFEVDRERLAAYVLRYYRLMATISIPVVFGAPWLIYPWYKKTYVPRLMNTLCYRLGEQTLRAESGVYFHRQANIPLWKITDVLVSQGPLERRYGLSRLHIQTAGQGAHVAEAVLMGLVDPEGVRQLILDRMAAVGQRGE
jgi:putative membrane protein